MILEYLWIKINFNWGNILWGVDDVIITIPGDSIENVETIEGKKCLILKDAEFEEEAPQERKFILERKLSSSEAWNERFRLSALCYF